MSCAAGQRSGKGGCGPATPDREGDRLASPRAGLVFLGQPLGDQETALNSALAHLRQSKITVRAENPSLRTNLFFKAGRLFAPHLTADRPTPVGNRRGIVLESIPAEAGLTTDS